MTLRGEEQNGGKCRIAGGKDTHVHICLLCSDLQTNMCPLLCHNQVIGGGQGLWIDCDGNEHTYTYSVINILVIDTYTNVFLRSIMI